MQNPNRPWLSLTALFLVAICACSLAVEDLPNGQSLLRNGFFVEPENPLEFWSPRDGGLGTFEAAPPPEPGSSGVLTIKVNSASPRPWSMELNQQVDAVIEKDAHLYISFDYKMTPGYSFNFYWQQEVAPWPKLLSLHVTAPVDTWHRIHMLAPVHESYAAQNTAFSFHLAEKTGILQLRNMSAILIPKGTPCDNLVVNVSPVFGGDFYDNDWRSQTIERLNWLRKVPVSIDVRKNGKPVGGATATLSQKKRTCQFGVEAKAALFTPELIGQQELRDTFRTILPYRQSLPAYRDMVLQSPFTDFVTFSDALVWKENFAWGKKIDEAAVAAVLQAGKQVHGYALYIPAYMFAPPMCRNMDKDALRQALLEHVSTIVTRHKDTITEWDAVHEALLYKEIYNFIGLDSLTEVFKTARAISPNATLRLGDTQALRDISEAPMESFIELVDWVRRSGVQVDGVTLCAEMRRLDVAPQSMEKRLNRISAALQLPIHISSLAVNAEDPLVQADMLKDYLLLFYSHPAVASVCLAEQWAPAQINALQACVNGDFSKKPAAKMLEQLLGEEWLTKQSVELDAEGKAFFGEIFAGDYTLSIEQDGAIRNIPFSLPQRPDKPVEATQGKIRLTLTPENGVIHLELN